MYNTYTFDNGLRLIHRHSPDEVVYCGYAIKAGTRDELPGEEGLAHFCEHAMFKGTEHRKAWQLIQAIEGVGGELNAFTNKETTFYHCAVLKEHLTRAVDVLTDMVFHSAFPETELEKEKEVICDEIESYNDMPSDLIYDEFENVVFANHPLGHNVLGTKESVRSFTGKDARRFTQRFYRPENMIFFLYGNISFTRLKALIGKAMAGVGTAPVPSASVTDGVAQPEKVEHEQHHQAHVMLGCRAYDIHHPLRIPLYLLSNILGGPSMSSRLNMSLREKNGLVYTVESSMVSYRDTGIWGIYFGCDHKDVKRCLRLVRKELDFFMEKKLSPVQLKRAKNQIKGQIALACDSRESFAIDFAKSFLLYGWEKDITALYASIDRITADDLQQVAQELFAEENILTLTY